MFYSAFISKFSASQMSRSSLEDMDFAIEPTWAATDRAQPWTYTQGGCSYLVQEDLCWGVAGRPQSTLRLCIREGGRGYRALLPGRSFLGPRLSYSLCSLLPLSATSAGTPPSWPFFPRSWVKPFPHFDSSSFLLENLVNSE